MRKLLTIILFISIANISYGQKVVDKKDEAQKLISQADDLLYKPGEGSLVKRNNNLNQSISLAKKSIQLGCGLVNTHLPTYFLHRDSRLCLLQRKGNLRFCKLAFFHKN